VKALVQRVQNATVTVDLEADRSIDRGLLVYLGIAKGDTETDLAWLSEKVLNLRIFPDDAGKISRSVTDIGGSMLVVSQFTLCADLSKGNRPSFFEAMEPLTAKAMVDAFASLCAKRVTVQQGTFGADMRIESVNDGPVTIWIDSAKSARLPA
jgi:D-aminoacyl-tRNA deacylase